MARSLRVGIRPVTVVDEARALARARSLTAPILRGPSTDYYRPITKPATFEDLAAAATKQLGFGSNVGRLAVELQRGNAVDPYDLAAVEAKRRTEQAAVEYFPGTNIPDSYGMQAMERRRAAARGAR